MQNFRWIEYLPILVALIISILISIIIVFLSYIVAPQKADNEKVSAYECGFRPFDDARGTFDIRFYLISILFIVFDLEVSFLFPWAICFQELTWFGYMTMMFFLLLLTVGFVYEWNEGALDWE